MTAAVAFAVFITVTVMTAVGVLSSRRRGSADDEERQTY